MGKLVYTMGEVAQMLGENASAVRYWSNYFEKFIHPQRNAKGNRLYHPEDIDTLKQVQSVSNSASKLGIEVAAGMVVYAAVLLLSREELVMKVLNTLFKRGGAANA